MVFLDKNSEKKIYRVLTTIVGLSSYNSRYICKKFGFQKECTFKDLDNSDFEQLRNYLTNNFFLEKLLKEQISKHVQKKIDLGIYQGKRHNLGYPVRGQRTLSNGKTQKKLHKFRFHYASELFTHAFFKNQRKSKNSKKLAKIKKQKEEKVKKQEQQKAYRNQMVFNNSIKQRLKNKEKEKEDNVAYLKKLEKIKAERQKQVQNKFIKAHKEAQKTHPYFINIMKAKVKKKQKKK
jgi:small subunit ribosomal protein S13